jgi:hypothetical protein
MLTVKPHTYEIIERWSESQKKPMARCITELLEQQTPMIQVMTQAFEAAQSGKRVEALQAMQALTGKALGQLGNVMQGKKHK